VSALTASEPFGTTVDVSSARAIVSEDHDHVMLDVVETYVNAPDHIAKGSGFAHGTSFVMENHDAAAFVPI
jgi:hypothetical protein